METLIYSTCISYGYTQFRDDPSTLAIEDNCGAKQSKYFLSPIDPLKMIFDRQKPI